MYKTQGGFYMFKTIQKSKLVRLMKQSLVNQCASYLDAEFDYQCSQGRASYEAFSIAWTKAETMYNNIVHGDSRPIIFQGGIK
jgi:hypothetical protein